MRRTAVLNLRNFDRVFGVFRKNGILIFLLIAFFCGLISGVITFEKFDSLEKIFSQFFIEDYNLKTNFISSLLDSFINSLLIICICFICGTSMLGIVLSPVCVALFGFAYGIFSATVYSQYALNGIAFYAVMILPSAVLVVVALLLSANESFKFSLFLIKQILSDSPPLNLTYVFKSFCFRYLIICLLVLVAAFVDALLTLNLSGKFALI